MIALYRSIVPGQSGPLALRRAIFSTISMMPAAAMRTPSIARPIEPSSKDSAASTTPQMMRMSPATFLNRRMEFPDACVIMMHSLNEPKTDLALPRSRGREHPVPMGAELIRTHVCTGVAQDPLVVDRIGVAKTGAAAAQPPHRWQHPSLARPAPSPTGWGVDSRWAGPNRRTRPQFRE